MPAPSPTDDVLALDRAGELLWVTLSRPEKANALSLSLVEALISTLDMAEADAGLRAIVIRGAGANFCGGADLAELLRGGPRGIRPLMERLRTLLLRLEHSRLAVIAAVHGAARAGGLELVLACDAVVASESATFGDAHLANALLPAGGETARLPRAIGWQRAKWMILSAAPISAATALDWGLLAEVSIDTQLASTAERIALGLVRAEADTFARAKQLLAEAPRLGFDALLEAEISALETHADTPAFQRGLAAFLGRRRS
jgi:enoyl-CoA hydratase/carnithine racemase